MTTCHKALSASLLAASSLVGAAAGCGGGESPTEVVLVTHDSFAVSDDVKAGLRAGERPDAPDPPVRRRRRDRSRRRSSPRATRRATCSSASTTTSSRARSTATSSSRTSRPALENVDAQYVLDAEHRVTPIDHGEVCLNYDKAWFAERGDRAAARRSTTSRQPRYDGLLVVENPATSTPGLAFLLATIARFGEDGWQGYWREPARERRARRRRLGGGVHGRFSGAAGSKGDRPIVVSYASSPPAEVFYRSPAARRRRRRRSSSRAASARSSSPACSAARGTRTARESSSTSCSRSASRRTFRSRCSSSPSTARRRSRPCSSASRSCPRIPLELPPSEIEANRDRLDRRVDANRAPLSGRGFSGAQRTAFRSRSSRSSSSSRSPPIARARPPLGGRRSRRRSTSSPTRVTREVVWFTVWQAIASTALTLAVALPAAYVLGRFAFPGRALVRALVVVPFVLPTVVVALAFLALLPDGLERGWAAILVAHAFFNVAVVVRVVGTFWAGLDPRVSEAAATLGAGPWRRLREVTLPLLAPSLAAAAADRVPLLLHVVRRRPDPRRPRLRDARGRDLQPGRPALRPAGRRDPLARAARCASP